MAPTEGSGRVHRRPLAVVNNSHLNTCAEAELQCCCGEWVMLPVIDCPSYCPSCGTLWVEEAK